MRENASKLLLIHALAHTHTTFFTQDLERQMKALQMALDGNEVNGAERNSKEEQQPQQQQQQQGSSGTQQAEASTKNAEEDGGYFSFTPQMSR